jgi:hypothetical protein
MVQAVALRSEVYCNSGYGKHALASLGMQYRQKQRINNNQDPYWKV